MPKRVRHPHAVPLPAETGHPEMGAEFACRMAGKFVLLGPGERKKGGEGAKNSLTTSNHQNVRFDDVPGSTGSESPPLAGSSNAETTCEDGELQGHNIESIPVTYPHESRLLRKAKDQYSKDPFYKQILDSPKAFKNFELVDGFIQLHLHNHTVFCVPNIRVGDRRLQEAVIDQAHSLLAHLGARKTLSYLHEYVWWNSMVSDVTAFCASCTTCQRSKPPNQKPYGLLNPLPVPAKPWEAIGIDFVGPLPESKDQDGEYDSITVIIDLLTAMVHLVPSRSTYTARDVAELMFAEVYKHHGLPHAIISDCDVLFTSLFWTHLNRLIGIKQKMSSAYHPEMDGSTEHANRTIGQML